MKKEAACADIETQKGNTVPFFKRDGDRDNTENEIVHWFGVT